MKMESGLEEGKLHELQNEVLGLLSEGYEPETILSYVLGAMSMRVIDDHTLDVLSAAAVAGLDEFAARRH